MEIIGLLPNFGNVIWTVVAFVVALSVIVAVHEYGHYIVGRWSGIHAEVFSLGFGPVLWKRTDRRGTQWQVAALPFGGYVKFLGDADAASGKDGAAMEGLSDEERRHTMHGAPLWARAATVAAGPVFNFVLSLLIFSAVILLRGTAMEPVTVGAMKPVPEAVRGLEPGDTIHSIGGIETPDFEAFYDAIATLDPARPVIYGLDRGEVEGPYPFPALIDAVTPGSAAMDAGLEPGDVITAADGQPIVAFRQLQEAIAAGEGRAVLLDVWRPGAGGGGEARDFTLVPRQTDLPSPGGGFETKYLIGINGGLVFEPATRTPGPFEALGYGAGQTWFIVTSSVSGLYHMITGAISSCNLRGPIGIAETSGDMASQGLSAFIWFIAVLSTAVGLLNLFPVPVLDGGHLVFHAWEAVTGKPPSDGALRVLMGVGLALILALMVFALGNDLFCP